MINVARRWIKQDRDQSKKIKIELKLKRLVQRLTKQREKASLRYALFRLANISVHHVF